MNAPSAPLSFDRVHRRHRRALHRAARRTWHRLGGTVDLDDIEQEARVALLRTCHEHDPSRAPLWGHVHRRLTWTMGDVFRRERPRLERQIDSDQMDISEYEQAARPGASPEELVIARDLRTRLREAMTKLPPRERRLVEGYYLQGLQLRQVAASMGISPFAASRLHRRAVATLTRRLAERSPSLRPVGAADAAASRG